MRRLAIYIDDNRFEFADWDGEQAVTRNGHATTSAGIQLLNQHLRDHAASPSFADVVVRDQQNHHASTDLPTELTNLLNTLPAVRFAGSHPRESAIFGWARSIAIQERKPTSTVIDATADVARVLTYNLRQERCDDRSVPLSAIGNDVSLSSDICLALVPGKPDSSVADYLPAATRTLESPPEKGNFAVGQLHSDIVIREAADVPSDADDRTIEVLMAATMDTVFDAITSLGYDLDNGICQRELEFVNTATGASTMIEPDMRIDRAALIERVARSQPCEPAQIEIKRVVVTGIIEPMRPASLL